MKDEPRELEDLRSRTKRFALQILLTAAKLPKTDEISVLRRQMIRSGTSVAAHYREACRARSDAEFVSKIEGGFQELDETSLWLELLIESHWCDWPDIRKLLVECNELIAIFVTIARKRKV
jgi:four helix bundle protein